MAEAGGIGKALSQIPRLGISNETWRYLKLIPKIAQFLATSTLYGISSNC